jgi:hypothetical protein
MEQHKNCTWRGFLSPLDASQQIKEAGEGMQPTLSVFPLKAGSILAGEEVYRMSWNAKGHYYICKSPPFVPMRRNLSTHSFATCVRTWRGFWTKSSALPRHVGYMFRQTHFLWFCHPNCIWRVLKFRHLITTCDTWGFLRDGHGDLSFLGCDTLSRHSWVTLKIVWNIPKKYRWPPTNLLAYFLSDLDIVVRHPQTIL